MKFASEEIRTKAVKAYLGGIASTKKLAEIFGYCPSTINKWVKAYKTHNQLSPKPNGHRKKCFSEQELEELETLLEKRPDLTLEEIRSHFNKSCCLAAIHRMLIKMGFKYKKTLKASEQNREDVQIKRKKWREFQKTVNSQKLVFLDATGAKTNMTRLYGRARKGRRCFDHTPDGRWERTTILSAVRINGKTCSVVFDGSLDREMFNAYVEKFLAPELSPGDIVIMDNLNVHKSEIVKDLIERRGCFCIFLPEYSPDLNPIEKMWSKIKQLLGGMKPRTRDELEAAIGKALNAVTPEDAEGWFASCGYA